MKQQLTLFANKKGATISDCGKYRYWLTRIWNDSKLKILWIMLNPSTADENEDDPTIRRCIGFAKQWGYGGICVANLYAYRATDKTALSKVTDPVGQDNRWYIDEYYESNMLIVLAYGDPPPTVMKSPVFKAFVNKDTYCLGFTKKGNPKHPLYIPKNQKLIPFSLLQFNPQTP